MPQPADLPNHYLASDARNLGLVLNQIRKEPDAKERLLWNLSLIYEGVRDVDVSVEGGTVQIFLHEHRWVIPATRLSDGTLRWLSLLAILLNPKPTSLVCIEEPETGLHPDLIPALANLLRAASERMQLVVTTHSDALVNALSDTPKAVLVCEKHEGSTTVRRLNKTDLSQRDGWEPPPGATDENTHLRVQCLESWFLADPSELDAYFGQGFQASALPEQRNIEDIAKADVFRALEHATRQTRTKGAYSKGGHSFALLARIDPAKVRNASPQAERLAGFLLGLCA